MNPSSSSKDPRGEKYTLTLSDGRTVEGYIHGGCFYYADPEPLKFCSVGFQVTVNEQANDRCYRPKKKAKE